MLQIMRTFALLFLLACVISAETMIMLARFCFSLRKLEIEQVETLDPESKGRSERISIGENESSPRPQQQGRGKDRNGLPRSPFRKAGLIDSRRNGA